ncbi:MAG: thioesterase domain-containing protein [Pseudomonadota bacterium]
MYRVILKFAATLFALSFLVFPANALEVYMFKGAGDFSFVNKNMHFSRGLDRMAKTLNAEGIHTEVRRFGSVEDALATIRRRKPKSIAFVGHSMGALASMAMARNLKGEGIDIAYMALLDIPGPVGVAGDNVNKVENYYTVNPVYGRLTNVRSHRDARNIHIAGYIHNRLDDAPKVQQGILKAIRAIHARENQAPVRQPELLMAVQAPATQPRDIPQLSAANLATASIPTADPWASYRTTSVRVQTPVQTSQLSYPDRMNPAIDPVTTSSVRPSANIGPGSVRETGRDLLRKIGGYLKSPSRERAPSKNVSVVGR